MRCNGMGSYEFVMRCGWLRCHVVWFEAVVWWGELEDDLVIRTTKYYSVLHSTTNYYTVLQSATPYYTVLQSTTPYYTVLLRTTQYYKALLRTTQYYSVLHSTTKHYSVLQSTTPYYKVLLRTTQYYKALLRRKMTLIFDPVWNVIYNAQSNRTHPPTSPNTVPARKNDAHAWCPSRPVQCAEQPDSPSNIPKYCTCHEKWLSSLILLTYETSFTMRGATGINLQPHQILRLPRKTTLMIDARHIWNVIYNAGSHRAHPPTSPNTAPVTQKCTPKSKRNLPKTVEGVIYNARPIRPWSDHELVISHPPVRRSYFSRFRDAFCIEKYNLSRSGYLPILHQICACHEKSGLPRSPNAAPATKKKLAPLILVTYETSFTMRGATGVIHQCHHVLCLPRKMTRIIDPHDISNVIYNAQSNRTHPPTSPNIAPATLNDSHDWCPSHMKRHSGLPSLLVEES